MNVDRVPISNRYVYATILVCLLMMTSVLWLPSQLGALSQAYGIGPRMLGLLGSAEFGGFLLGTAVGSFPQAGSMRPWILTGGVIAIASNVALVLYAPALPLIVIRPLASSGAGLAFAYALKICSKSANPTRSFGIFTGFMSVGMIIGFQAVGHLLQDRTGAHVVAGAQDAAHVVSLIFTCYAALALGAMLVYLGNQPTVANDTAPGAGGRATVPGAAFVGLGAIGLSYIGQGSVFAFLQTMGVSQGFPVAGVANAMSAWAVFGIVGSFTAGAFPQHVPRWSLIGIASLIMLGGYVALYAPASLQWYTVGCAIGGFYWNFILPLMLGLMSTVDPTGRGSVWGGSMSSGGSMLGAGVAGLLIVGTHYTPVGWLSAALISVGFSGMLWVERSRSQKTPERNV
jgi:predicted MFS family arabinose efflux permease